jgi:hypothetical protein
MAIQNFLRETLTDIHRFGQCPESIVYIGDGGNYFCSWDEFQLLANFRYDSGFGSTHIPLDLVIVFKDHSWLSRDEYDGAEWWRYNQVPNTTLSRERIRTFNTSLCWKTIKDIHTQDPDIC